MSNRWTFSGIESGSIDLPAPNFVKAVDLYHPQPLLQFQVVNLSRVNVMVIKSIFTALRLKIARHKQHIFSGYAQKVFNKNYRQTAEIARRP